MAVNSWLVVLARRIGHHWTVHNRQIILKALRIQITPSPMILDVGCGDGGFLQMLSVKFDANCMVGVDLSLNELNILKLRSSTLHLIRADAIALPLRNSSFDLIFAKDLLHHVGSPTKVLWEFERLVRNSGTIAVVESNRDNVLMSMYIRYGHLHFTLSRLTHLMKGVELEVQRIASVQAYPHHFLFWSGKAIELLWDLLALIFLSFCNFFPRSRAYLLKIMSLVIRSPSYNIIITTKRDTT